MERTSECWRFRNLSNVSPSIWGTTAVEAVMFSHGLEFYLIIVAVVDFSPGVSSTRSNCYKRMVDVIVMVVLRRR